MISMGGIPSGMPLFVLYKLPKKEPNVLPGLKIEGWNK